MRLMVSSWLEHKISNHGYPTRYKVRDCVEGWVRSVRYQRWKGKAMMKGS